MLGDLQAGTQPLARSQLCKAGWCCALRGTLKPRCFPLPGQPRAGRQRALHRVRRRRRGAGGEGRRGLRLPQCRPDLHLRQPHLRAGRFLSPTMPLLQCQPHLLLARPHLRADCSTRTIGTTPGMHVGCSHVQVLRSAPVCRAGVQPRLTVWAARLTGPRSNFHMHSQKVQQA